MQVTLPDEVEAHAVAAGFRSAEDYVLSLVEKDAERLAIEEGLAAVRRGEVRDWEDVKQDLRAKFGGPASS